MLSLDVIRAALRIAWGLDTCDPHDVAAWEPSNPARGQCGVTALVVHDLLGGHLMLGEVFVGHRKVGHHYWNRIPDGSQVDFTADQFHRDENVVGGRLQLRPPGPPRRCSQQYDLLRQRVHANLAI